MWWSLFLDFGPGSAVHLPGDAGDGGRRWPAPPHTPLPMDRHAPVLSSRGAWAPLSPTPGNTQISLYSREIELGISLTLTGWVFLSFFFSRWLVEKKVMR